MARYTVILNETQRQIITRALHNLDPAKVALIAHFAEDRGQPKPQEELQMLTSLFGDLHHVNLDDPEQHHDFTA